MSEFVKIAELTDIPNPGKHLCEVGDRLVVVFRIGDEVYCLDDVCTHDGGPLGEGTFVDHSIACPRHGAKFDIRTGKPLSMPATEATRSYDVRVENGNVLVKLEDA